MPFWRKIASFLLATAVLLLAYNYISNWHFHKMPNGTVIVHAHPYPVKTTTLPNPENNHSHTQHQYDFLSFTTTIAFLAVLLFALILIFIHHPNFRQIYRSIKYTFFFPGYFHLRAPPVTSS